MKFLTECGANLKFNRNRQKIFYFEILPKSLKRLCFKLYLNCPKMPREFEIWKLTWIPLKYYIWNSKLYLDRRCFVFEILPESPKSSVFIFEIWNLPKSLKTWNFT